MTRGYYSLLDHLYPTGYDQIDRVDNKGRSVLMIGVINQRHDIVEKLIHYGADLCLCDSEGKTAYDFAKQSGHKVIKQSLDQSLSYQLRQACELHDLKRAQELIRAGASLFYKENHYSNTILDDLIIKGDLGFIEDLVQSGVKVDININAVATALYHGSWDLKFYLLHLYVKQLLLKLFKGSLLFSRQYTALVD